MQVDISIIVPVYNSEKYLEACIEAILNQTFSNFELILVNDGSNDNSINICKLYSDMDNRIKVIDKKNGGAASARNSGLDIARGKYIGFVDSDDLIHNEMYEILYKTAIDNSSDIVICDFEDIYYRNINLSNRKEHKFNIENFNNIESLNRLCKARDITYITPWNKLYSKRVFEGLRYNEGQICEDEFIAHRIFYNSRITTYIPSNLYYYFQSDNSVMRSEFSIKKLASIDSILDRVKFFREIREKELTYKAEKLYVIVFLRDYYKAKNLIPQFKCELKKYKKSFNKEVIELLKNPLFNKREKLMFLLLFIAPYFHEKYMKIKG